MNTLGSPTGPARLYALLLKLREEFMDFCDHLNLDAIFEPVKS